MRREGGRPSRSYVVAAAAANAKGNGGGGGGIGGSSLAHHSQAGALSFAQFPADYATLLRSFFPSVGVWASERASERARKLSPLSLSLPSPHSHSTKNASEGEEEEVAWERKRAPRSLARSVG